MILYEPNNLEISELITKTKITDVLEYNNDLIIQFPFILVISENYDDALESFCQLSGEEIEFVYMMSDSLFAKKPNFINAEIKTFNAHNIDLISEEISKKYDILLQNSL